MRWKSFANHNCTNYRPWPRVMLRPRLSNFFEETKTTKSKNAAPSDRSTVVFVVTVSLMAMRRLCACLCVHNLLYISDGGMFLHCNCMCTRFSMVASLFFISATELNTSWEKIYKREASISQPFVDTPLALAQRRFRFHLAKRKRNSRVKVSRRQRSNSDWNST